MYSQVWRRRDQSSFGYGTTNHVEFKRVVPPATTPVTLTQLKQNARIPYSDQDDILSLYLQAATDTIERFLRRALITQTWDGVFDWGPAWIELPKQPLQRVNAVYTTDLANIEHLVPPTTYIVNPESHFIGLNIGNVWPLHRGKAGYRINWTCGYGDNPDDVPAPIRRAILSLATTMDNLRDDVAMSESLQTAMMPYRVAGAPWRMARGMAREDILA